MRPNLGPAFTGEDETEKYLRPQHLKKLGDDSLPQEGYIEFNTGARSASRRISMHSLSSDRSNTVNRTSFARESMIEDILVPTKSTHLAVTREENECFRHYSWTPDTMDHAQSTMSSPIHSGFLVSFMVDARGGSMRGSRHNGMRIIIPPRNCPAPTRVTCRLLKRQCLPYPPPLVEGEGFVSRLVEVGPAGVHFLGPVIVEIPHFGSMRGKERELIVLRNDNGNTWKEHHYECRTEDLIALLNGMDEELDSPVELEKKHICRIITKDFPQYFAVVSRIKQENDYMGPEGGILTSESVPMVRAVFPPGALTKKIRVGLQAQPVPEEIVCSVIDNRASFSPIVTVEPRRRKFHKPIIMTIPVPPSTKEVTAKGRKGEPVPCLRLLCSITGGTSPAQWEDITGTTPLSFVTDCVSFTTNVSARFWLADCQQVSDTVALATLIYKELICVPYLAKFVVFAKPIDVAEAQLRCFCMTDDKVDKTLEQQEDFEEVARSKDTEISEGKPIYVHCYGNLSPASKISQQLFFTFDAFKENRLPFIVKVWDIGQEPCGRLAFLKELKTTKGLAQSTICNLNFTLPAQKKEMETEPDNENDKDQRHIIASLALRQRFSCLSDPTSKKTKRGNTALKTTSQTSGYSYKPAFMTHQYQAWVTSPVASASGQAKSGFVSLSSSSSNTLSATPLRSGLSGNSDSPITSVIRGSFTPSIKSVSDVALPIRSHRAVSSSQKIVEQQAQNPVQASLTPLSSPVKNIPDSVSVKALPSLSARTSLLPAGGSLLEKPFITRTPPASPTSSPKSSNSSNFSYKSANISNVLTTASPIKTFSGLTTVKTTTNTSSSHSSPTKYHSPSPIFLLSGSLQERIQATTFAATTSVNAAFDEVERTLNSCSASYEKLKAVPSSPPSTYQSILSSGSVYDSLSPPPNSTTSVTYSTVAVPVYSVINVLPERQFKKLPNISKSTATLLSPRKAMAPEANAQIQSTSARILSPGKTFPFMSPATSSSPLSNSQDILKDVHEMKEDLIRMSAILQTDTCAKGFQSNSNKEHKIEDEEAYKIMEKVKQDLVKVSEILTNDILKEGKKYKKGSKAEDLEHDIDNNQQNGWRCPPRYETVAPQVKKRVMTDRDFNLAKVLDYLTYDTGTHSLSKTEAAPQRNEESRRERKEKVKRVLKPAMAVQESKLKMPPLIMHPSPSEKALSKLADALFGTEAVLDSDDVSHDQDKSPLSDSGFETRSEKTPSAPQSADSMGPTAPFQEISPVITETRTETVHVIRCYRPPEVTNEPVVDEVKMANSLAQCTDTEFRLPSGYHKDRVKTYQASSSPVEDIMCKGMRLKEEAHITTTTRMLYHKPASKETTSERFEETVMNSLQSGRDPSRELTGLFEHQGSNEGWKEPQRPLNKDSKPKVEHIIEVHIEKGNKTEPTEVIIMETKNHPEKEMYIYQSSIRKNELQNREEVEKVIPPFLQEDDVRTTTVQLMTKDLCKTLKLQRPHSVEYPEEDSSIMRRESNKITDKMLFTEKFNSSYSDSDESLTERSHYYEMRTHGGSVRYIMLKPDKTGGVLDDNENCDNLALLQYASDPASQKKSIWTRVSEDRQGGSTEKCKFEDRVDKTVKEAEEKLSEVSWFFRDKTKKLKDELQSPEKKNHRPNSQEAQSVPSSTCSSPERTVLKNGGSGEQWSRERFRDRYGSHDRKCTILPSSTEGSVLIQYSDDNRKQGDYSLASSANKSSNCFKPSTSKVSSVRMKFEAEAKKQDLMVTQCGQTSGPLEKKLQENKLPIYQVFAGGNLPNPTDPGEHCPKEVQDNERRQIYNVRKAQLYNVCDNTTPKHPKSLHSKDKVDTTQGSHGSGHHKSQKSKIFYTLEENTLVDNEGSDKLTKEETTKKIIYTELQIQEDPNSVGKYSGSLKKKSELHVPVRVSSSFVDHHESTLKLDSSVKPDRAGSLIPSLARSKHCSCDANNSFSDMWSLGRINVFCNGVDSEQIEYTERVTPSVTANIKPLPVYVSIPVGKQYGKETATGQPSTYKKVVSHESQTMHEAREVFYTVKQRQQPSPQWNPEDDTLENVTSSGRSPITPETPSSEEVSYDLNSRAPDTVIVSVAGEPSPIPEESEEEEQPKTFIFREVPAENPKAVKIPPEFSKGNHELPGKRVKGKQVAYFEFPPFPPQDTQLSDQMELKKDSPPSEADTEMMEVNLQEEHDRHLFAEPVIQIHPPSPLPPGADNNDSSDDESVIQPIPLKKYNFKMTQNGKKCVKPRNPDRNGSHHKESQSINGVIKGDEEDEQNGNDQSVTDCSIATTAEFSHDTDATEIDSLDGYDLQDEDDGLSDTKTSSLSNDVKTGNCSFSLTKLEVRKESTPNKESGENTKSKSNLYKKTESGKDQCKIYSLEGRHPDRQEFADNYFSYKLEEELHSTFKTVATKGLDFDPWSNKGGEEEVFEAKSKDEDPKYFGLLVEEKSQATTPDTTPARTPTDDSTPSSEPNPFPFHEGKMFEMTRSGAIDMSKRDFVEERLQFFQIGEHTAKGKTGDKGKRGKCVVVSASQSKAGGRSVEGMVEATTNITPSRNCPTQGITCCLDAPSCTDIVGETTSCTVTASKVNPKFHIPIKMGIAASITIKKDSADWTDFRAESSASQMLEHDNLETHVNYCQFGSTCSDSPSDRKDCPSENSSNNNNLEACSVQANYIHGGSIVFNLQSSSEPTLQKASRVEAHFCRTSLVLVKDKSNAQTLQWKTDSQKGLEIKCQPKSRLPVKIAGFSFNTHNSGKQISQQIVKPETRKCDSISIKPRSRIPVKDIKRNSAVSSAVGPKLGKLLEGERVVRKVASSQLPTRDRSSWTIKNCSVEADRTNISGLCRKSIKFLQNISVEAAKVTEHLSDKEKQTQAEQLEKDSSTSRCTSLSDPSQSQPSLSDGSSRGGAPIRSKVTRSAGSERRRSRRTGGGKEGNRGTGVCGLPYIAEIKPSPQSPCERTDLRMAIVADHLGLSWTELAREMNFSVDEINHIRKENPNSLTAQSFMLLKQWVSRDGKNATTDALTAVLTKVNRMDIVTLLEGPIFDYGNISGTRSFADDSAVEKSYEVMREFSSGVEEEEIKEERGQEPTYCSGECDNRLKLRERDRVRDAELEVCSLSAGLLSENSNINVDPPIAGQGLSFDLLDQQDNCQKNSTDSMTSSSRWNSGKSEQNGKRCYAPCQNTATWDLSTGVEGGAMRDKGTLILEHKVKVFFLPVPREGEGPVKMDSEDQKLLDKNIFTS
ncbi:ankyrin-3-like isoform X4 [Pangasianodon hypophthalmus]|uniref:ankyrin-3-like isoform X4 n=1 Tax=Pangasianodon hypophthalmus TaxID=310915 RepID=UPI0023083376|nr:ankyrin-3-like isoform X4 [Pangasianodon hypophthalmus]